MPLDTGFTDSAKDRDFEEWKKQDMMEKQRYEITRLREENFKLHAQLDIKNLMGSIREAKSTIFQVEKDNQDLILQLREMKRKNAIYEALDDGGIKMLELEVSRLKKALDDISGVYFYKSGTEPRQALEDIIKIIEGVQREYGCR